MMDLIPGKYLLWIFSVFSSIIAFMFIMIFKMYSKDSKQDTEIALLKEEIKRLKDESTRSHK